LSLYFRTTLGGRVTARERPAWTSFLFISVLSTYGSGPVKRLPLTAGHWRPGIHTRMVA
jgi:hypothetical protein